MKIGEFERHSRDNEAQRAEKKSRELILTVIAVMFTLGI